MESLTADPDSDGMSNQVEYGLGGNPSLSDSHDVLPGLELNAADGADRVVYVYRRRRDAAACGLSYVVESSMNLIRGDWEALPVNTNTEPVYIDSDFELVTHAVSADVKTLFLRLKIKAEW